jgi:3-oxoacyl-[acyl-carrier protein] reductase
MVDLGLNGKIAVVLAGSQGLGFASAQALAREGATVAICARSASSLEQARLALGGTTFAQTADVTQADDVTRFFEAVLARFGTVDILVNNAGGPPPGPFSQISDADWSAAIDLTLMSVVHGKRAVRPTGQKKKRGRIITLSSYSVKSPIAELSLSNSIRLAVLGWAKTLSNQVAADGITVNTVCPGWTRTERVDALIEHRAAMQSMSTEAAAASITDMIPAKRMGHPEEVGALVAFLAADIAGYITGAAIAIDGGVSQSYS